jgi:type VI secretion system VasD/TssJ family lipoprotein
MKTVSILMLALTAILTVFSCASRPPTPPEWRYEEAAIKLYVRSDPQVNLYDGEAHALHVCAYQLRDPNTFNQLAETSQGISDLLQCSLFDASVANAKVLSRLGIQPAKVLTFTLDRAEGAKYLGIVAGYQILDKERTVRLFDIPVVTETKGWPSSTKTSRPAHLSIEVNLGPRQIEQTTAKIEEK